MASLTKITWKKRDGRDAKLLKNRQKKLKAKQKKAAAAKKK